MTRLASIKKTALREHLENPTQYFSERNIARQAEISHTLLQRILRDPKKTRVLEGTARNIEDALEVPNGTFFDYTPTREKETP